MARLDIDPKGKAATGISETASSSSSVTLGGSPQVELVGGDSDVEYSNNPPIAIIDDDDEILMDAPDPALEFPFIEGGETPLETLRALGSLLQNGKYRWPVLQEASNIF